MTFRVGQKVVCVNASACPTWGALTIRKNTIYTVADVAEVWGDPVIGLVEDRSPHHTGFYQAHRFRPVVERKTDISIFTAMLKPSKVRA